MNKEQFDVTARQHGADVYGNVFSESGYGISFCFDICYALYVYNLAHPTDNIQDALAKCLFFPGIEFSARNFINDDTGEYSTSQGIYTDMEVNKNSELYISMLNWYFDNKPEDN